MADPLGIAIPLALGVAISPATLAVQLVTLSRPTAPLARAWAIAAGICFAFAAFLAAASLPMLL